MRRPLLALIGVVLVAGVPTTARAYTTLIGADMTGNGVADTWLLDDDGDGTADRMRIDANESGVAEAELGIDDNGVMFVAWLDANLDGIWDSVVEPVFASSGTAIIGKTLWLDANQDGLWENRYYDSDLNNYYEWVMVDSNYDGVADVWRGNSAPAATAAPAVVAGQLQSVGAVNVLHGLGLSVFFPSATIPLGG